ncbi:MAG: XTP/dITP diphosphatase [Clostridia bacterium]|nr:XTP/dITP diphosphatase [Clostridia bacterium]
MIELVLATNNAHKVEEIQQILGGRFQIRTLAEENISVEVEETGASFAENAIIKASVIAKLTGKYALSDDSGLVVAALGGKPGIYSARYAGEGHDDKANIIKLLDDMQHKQDRSAKFVSAVALCKPNGEVVIAEGAAEGEILREQRGAGGFGYDPVFFSHELQKTFAEATAQEKNAVSHRKRALQNLAAKLSLEYS